MSQFKIELALSNTISAIQKMYDAPISADTHLRVAIVHLLSLCDSYHADGEDADDILFAMGYYFWLMQVMGEKQ